MGHAEGGGVVTRFRIINYLSTLGVSTKVLMESRIIGCLKAISNFKYLTNRVHPRRI